MKKFFIFSFVALLLFSCTKQKDIPLGYNLVKEVTILQPQIEKTDYFQVTKNTGSSIQLLLGKYKDEYTSYILLHFNSFPDSAIIEKANIILFPQVLYGDSTIGFEANMYSVNESWEQEEVVNVPNYSQNSISTTFIEPVNSDSVVFTVPNNIVEQWMDTTNVNNGILLDCKDAQFIRSFYSIESNSSSVMPRMEITYHTTTDADTSLEYLVAPDQDAFVIESNIENLPDNLLYIGDGLALRSFLKFDIEDYLENSAIINKAELRLVINSDYTIFNNSNAAHLRLLRIDNEWTQLKNATIDSTFSGYTGQVFDDTLKIDIKGLLQQWVLRNSDYENKGFLLQSDYESQTITRVAFYSSAEADEERVPKILVTYTELSEED